MLACNPHIRPSNSQSLLQFPQLKDSMATMKATSPATLAAFLILMTLAGDCFADLKVGFYANKCGTNKVEAIVFNVIRNKFVKDPTLVAALLRMQFHDCFVRGCDASILLNGPNSEKNAGGNGSVRGYEIIDAVKTALEKACPGLVSCADIIAIATRAAVSLAGGRWYTVQTGRRDGNVSSVTEANNQLLGPTTPVSAVIQAFAGKGIQKEDVVLLLGAHTTGIAHCSFFSDRLYSFDGVSGRTDPSMNKTLVPFLKNACPQNGDGSNSVNLDQSKPGNKANIIDNGFFNAVVAGEGILAIDQRLGQDSLTRSFVLKYAANEALFQIKFGQAMVKLGAIGVLTGNEGQIRKTCSRVN